MRIVNVRRLDAGTVEVEIEHRVNRREIVTTCQMKLETFLNWDAFKVACEDAGIRTIVEPDARMEGDGLRQSWQHWVAELNEDAGEETSSSI